MTWRGTWHGLDALREAGQRRLERLERLVRSAMAASARRELRRQRTAGKPLVARRAGKPRALFVISTEIGGTPQTNRDLMAGLSPRYECFLLRSDTRVITLCKLQDGRLRRLRSVRLPGPLQPIPHTHPAYDGVVAGWLDEYGIDLVHIRHIAWHSLSLPRLARERGIPVVFSFHDYYTVCPTVRLVHEDGAFDSARCTSGTGRCRHVLWPEASKGLDASEIRRWRDAMASMLASCEAFATTSDHARELIIGFYPGLAAKSFPLIAHGRDFPAFASLGRLPARDEPVRVLVPGNISDTKGALVLGDIARLDGEGRFEFHVVGRAARSLRGLPRVILHGSYRREQFLRIAEKIRPHFGVVLSIWPETWCHTLTEMWAAGLPVAGFDLGAVGERLRWHGGGWPIPLAPAQQTLAALRRIVSEPAAFELALAEVAAWQAGAALQESRARMADDYDALFRRLIGGNCGAASHIGASAG
jgi:glycosyltransferase involved in cell wall biosynthesis